MFYVYHIKGIKVGGSKRVEARVKEQGYTEYEILEICNSEEELTERELYWQGELGYGRDNSKHYYSYMNKMARASKTEKAKIKFKETIATSETFKQSALSKVPLMHNEDSNKKRKAVFEKKKIETLQRAAIRKYLKMLKKNSLPHGNSTVVNQYNLNNQFIKQWISIKEAGDTLKLDRGGLSMAARGKYKTYGGFIWKYINP